MAKSKKKAGRKAAPRRREGAAQRKLKAALASVGAADASIENPAEQRAAAAQAREELEHEAAAAQVVSMTADALAAAILDRLAVMPARLERPASDRVTTGAGWAGDGAHFPEALGSGPVREPMGRNIDGPSIAGVQEFRPRPGAMVEPVGSPAKVAIGSLVSAICRLEEAAAVLRSRLEGVLPNRPEDPEGGGGLGRPMAGSSDLVREVEELSSRVDRAVARIMDIAHAVEV